MIKISNLKEVVLRGDEMAQPKKIGLRGNIQVNIGCGHIIQTWTLTTK
jgi:hypothetical protein